METNTCTVYDGLTEVYEKLVQYCYSKGFVIKENKDKFYFLKAKKMSMLFWRTLRMEMKIQAVGKHKVEVAFEIYKAGKRQSQMEAEFADAFCRFS